jgi:predicted PurR-regulated permease PerM
MFRPSAPTVFPPAATWALVIMAGLMILSTLQEVRSFAIPTVLALLAAIALEPIARAADRMHISRSISSAVIVLAAIAAVATLVYYVLPTAEEWNRRAPEVLRKLDGMMRNAISDVTDAVQGPAVNKDGEEVDPIDQLASSSETLLKSLAVTVPVLISGTLYAAILTFFMLRERVLLTRWVMLLGSTQSRRRALGRAIRDIQSNVSSYLLAITLINTCLGLVATLMFWLLGLPNPFLWGLLTGVLNFMPYIGPAIMAFIILGVGLVTYPGPQMSFLPVLAILILNTVEGQFVTPLLVGRQMRQSTMTIFMAIAFGAWLWGAAGALLATPVLLVASAFTRRQRLTRAAGLPRRPPGQPAVNRSR